MLEEEYLPKRVLPPHLRKPTPPASVFEYLIRPVKVVDLPSVRDIYNYYVANTVVTFDEGRTTHRYWREKFDLLSKLKLPFLVAVSPNGQVLGYALVAPWQTRRAYRYTVECSIYLGPAATGKGLGRALLSELLARSRSAGIREVLAVIADQGAESSIALHKKFGFVETGRMGRVGFKFERWLGTILFQKSLK